MFVSLNSNTTGVTCGAGTSSGPSGAYVVLCRSLFVPLSFFLWPLYCLSFDLRFLIAAFVMASFSYGSKCYWWRETNPPATSRFDWFKPNNIQPISGSFPLNTLYYGVKTNTDWLRIRNMCPYQVICLTADCCFSEWSR